MVLRVKKLVNEAKLPERKREEDAGLDLYCIEEMEINPFEIKQVSTGIAIEIPYGYFGLIKDRSGLSLKGLHVLAGVIDSNYRGEVKVVLVNLSKEKIKIEKFSRIAQLIIIPYLKLDVVEVSELEESERGKEGFGSTGIY
ncbi:MAG: dUTP diphosphatase [Candidatus Aenigmarchaeota archaeon]|nr:dUTP diphosphatase [Candidatus Aenigmarchaeota archaeon]MDW8149015.1 dUTP diphosphatase [Candidatus Aenigmarchaeota archaeon]